MAKECHGLSARRDNKVGRHGEGRNLNPVDRHRGCFPAIADVAVITVSTRYIKRDVAFGEVRTLPEPGIFEDPLPQLNLRNNLLYNRISSRMDDHSGLDGAGIWRGPAGGAGGGVVEQAVPINGRIQKLVRPAVGDGVEVGIDEFLDATRRCS
jgi:hypothetical protein